MLTETISVLRLYQSMHDGYSAFKGQWKRRSGRIIASRVNLTATESYLSWKYIDTGPEIKETPEV